MDQSAKVVRRHAEGERDTAIILDNGRRGDPLPGCDCVQCFGMCMVDREVAERSGFWRHDSKDFAPEFRGSPVERAIQVREAGGTDA